MKKIIILGLIVLLLTTVVIGLKYKESDCKKTKLNICLDETSPYCGCNMQEDICDGKYVEYFSKLEGKNVCPLNKVVY